MPRPSQQQQGKPEQKSILKLARITSETKSKTAEQPNRKKPDPKKTVITDQQPSNEKPSQRFLLSPKELQDKIDQYFLEGGTIRQVIVGNGSNKKMVDINIFTLTGLCLYCGFADKNELFMLERNITYKQVVKRARTRIEKIYEENLQTTGNSANIFALKNFGWFDRQETVIEDKRLKLDV